MRAPALGLSPPPRTRKRPCPFHDRGAEPGACLSCLSSAASIGGDGGGRDQRLSDAPGGREADQRFDPDPGLVRTAVSLPGDPGEAGRGTGGPDPRQASPPSTGGPDAGGSAAGARRADRHGAALSHPALWHGFAPDGGSSAAGEGPRLRPRPDHRAGRQRRQGPYDHDAELDPRRFGEAPWGGQGASPAGSGRGFWESPSSWGAGDQVPVGCGGVGLAIRLSCAEPFTESPDGGVGAASLVREVDPAGLS